MRTVLLTFLFCVLSSGFAAHASLSVSPSSVNFFNVRVGSMESQAVVVMNTGREAVQVAVSGACVGDFMINSFCGMTMSPGSSCSISVQFQPHRMGYQSCNMTVSDSSGEYHSVSLSGTGIRSMDDPETSDNNPDDLGS